MYGNFLLRFKDVCSPVTETVIFGLKFIMMVGQEFSLEIPVDDNLLPIRHVCVWGAVGYCVWLIDKK